MTKFNTNSFKKVSTQLCYFKQHNFFTVDVKQQVAREKQEAKDSETVRKAVANYSSSLGNDKILQNQVLMIEVIRSESIFENKDYIFEILEY
jgi:hypothetical protein